ncbi:ABC transporter ATP-binding protein [Desulfonema ishimotonii]|uniref:ABC transporter ATP-binding protein n=1 Tax=Desulfonema ishimotonii TaxID=45657 RepID=A0A401FXS5_9BACT|nr:ABC transporter ATP-binding protein [Desulfonema ishimotonii]GBC61812.1 ABC transporter ATP-binding protein [Desulfonema ishimotonii]
MRNSDVSDSEPVLNVSNLSIGYKTRRGMIQAVRDVSFQIRRGETLGIVGESGCGKSTVAFGIVDFLGSNGSITDGSVRFEGDELVGRSRKTLSRLRGDRIAMVYQDPMAALNPTVRIGEQLAEVLVCHRRISRAEAWERAIEMLKRVHMPDPENMMTRHTHQISGGQQQRVVIAMAMLNHPALLIMDEPTTALDVTVEATVLDLVAELKNEFNTGILFISHNLGVVARISDRVCVMYAGQVVEQGPVGDLFKRPSHPYTQGLMRCVPRLGTDKADSRLHPIRGRVPQPANRPEDACIFAPRCDYATDRCTTSWPGLTGISPDHVSRCFYARDIFEKNIDRMPPKREPVGPGRTGADTAAPLLRLENLRVYYEQKSASFKNLIGLGKPKFVKAVDEVSLEITKGRTLGIVGESGCGKSSLVRGIIGLEEITGGKAEFLNLDISQSVEHRAVSVIKEMQMVFQNPDATLNPAYPVGRQIARPIRRFGTVPKDQVRAEVIRLLRAVRLPPAYYGRYPRQLSGGEKQRVGIARALASQPDMVLCDEPVSALDVSVQAAVLNLLLEIQREMDTTLIFIAHDLSVVRFFSDEIAVMYLGQIMETGPAETIYAPPYHPYTEALLSAVPIPDPDAEQKNIRLSGNVPSALSPPSGCRFHTRCPRRNLLPDEGKICETERPPWRKVGGGHRILCHLPLDELKEIESVISAA